MFNTPPKASKAVEIYLQQVKENLTKLGNKVTDKTYARSSRSVHNHWQYFYDTIANLKARDDIVLYPADKNMVHQ